MRVNPTEGTGARQAPSGAAVVSAVPAQNTEAVMNPEDVARLDQLWQRRTATSSENEDYPIGPGDVLTVSVPDVEEIQQRKARVSAQGTIELPLVGLIQAGGLTEGALAQELDRKLDKFMFNPQASVFVDVYRNREAAVVGAVNKPGLVLLDAPTKTILDVLTQAGGLSATAADELILIPGEQGGAGAARRVLAALPSASAHVSTATQVASADPATGAMAGNAAPASDGVMSGGPKPKGDPETDALANMPTAQTVRIPLRSTSLTGGGRYMSLPARPGDVLVVPGGGQVMIVGWVHSPGHFEVGSGLTVLGAVGEAGGPMYAADTKEVALIRSEHNGSKETISVDLDKISRGEAPDVPVKANDVIDVPYSGWRIGPYVFYSVLTRVGIGGPMIPY
jgi:polysaccharide export outer membrane protein